MLSTKDRLEILNGDKPSDAMSVKCSNSANYCIRCGLSSFYNIRKCIRCGHQLNIPINPMSRMNDKPYRYN